MEGDEKKTVPTLMVETLMLAATVVLQ